MKKKSPQSGLSPDQIIDRIMELEWTLSGNDIGTEEDREFYERKLAQLKKTYRKLRKA